jgi:hypothetical protein
MSPDAWILLGGLFVNAVATLGGAARIWVSVERRIAVNETEVQAMWREVQILRENQEGPGKNRGR